MSQLHKINGTIKKKLPDLTLASAIHVINRKLPDFTQKKISNNPNVNLKKKKKGKKEPNTKKKRQQ